MSIFKKLSIYFNYLPSNIDTEELCTYFAQHLGEFRHMFGLLETFNKKMTEMLYATSKVNHSFNVNLLKMVIDIWCVVDNILYFIPRVQIPVSLSSFQSCE